MVVVETTWAFDRVSRENDDGTVKLKRTEFFPYLLSSCALARRTSYRFTGRGHRSLSSKNCFLRTLGVFTNIIDRVRAL